MKNGLKINWRGVGKWFVEKLPGLFVHWLDATAKIIAGVVAIFAVLALTPWVGRHLTAMKASRFGVEGVVLYEMGQKFTKLVKEEHRFHGDPDFSAERRPTYHGALNLLRSAKNETELKQREYRDLKRGNILHAKSLKYLRVEGGCGAETKRDCGSSPRIFTLETGDCVAVLELLYDNRTWSRRSFANPSGGWVRVATTSCGLFD